MASCCKYKKTILCIIKDGILNVVDFCSSKTMVFGVFRVNIEERLQSGIIMYLSIRI